MFSTPETRSETFTTEPTTLNVMNKNWIRLIAAAFFFWLGGLLFHSPNYSQSMVGSLSFLVALVFLSVFLSEQIKRDGRINRD